MGSIWKMALPKPRHSLGYSACLMSCCGERPLRLSGQAERAQPKLQGLLRPLLDISSASQPIGTYLEPAES
ncbi:hypothetical protein Y1Q_0018271 [Alligator mississippiensis]|uniref:Uncharacterized protein n=1 Tax=Alligator mississippiensis TaxID=8496 RepID=A0A151PBV5_ALLMI|nr:hypothetical protein Y1Q_0018271 [Alligator mississippiensis]